MLDSLAVPDGGTDGDELRHPRAPIVAADLQPHPDDPVRAELFGLLLHARHGEVTGLVQSL